MALFSLGLLVVAVFLGYFRKMNTGLICIAFSLLLGHIAGIPDKEVIAGFNYNLFLTLLGVTYLFTLAQNNGTLKLIAVKIISLAGKRTNLVPIYIFVFSMVLSAIGPGCIPTMAIMMVFAMTLASELGLNPAMLSALIVLSASGGGVSPIAPTGIIGITVSAASGITQDVSRAFMINGPLATTLYGIVVYIAFGGYKNREVSSELLNEKLEIRREHIITLLGIAVMVVSVLFMHVNVGLASFFVSVALSALGVVDEVDGLQKVPWGTLVLVCGVSVLIHLIVQLGGIKMLSGALASIMTPKTAPAIMSATGGMMAWVSSTSGVVMPAIIPTIPGIVEAMQGQVSPVELVTALTMVGHTAGMSPMSTGGCLALAAYTSVSHASPEEQQKLFLTMFATSACGMVFLSIMAYFGLFRWFI